jgi:hypothetical protein
MQVYIMKLISTILIASTAAALKAPRAAPTKALQVPRGGGMVEKSTALTVTKVVFGLYATQMLLVPDFLMTQNFKMKTDKYHKFITRISGLGWLGMLKCLGAMEEDDAFNTSFIVSIICTIIAPVNAEMNLECNTAHGAVYVLFPILLGAHALAM